MILKNNLYFVVEQVGIESPESEANVASTGEGAFSRGAVSFLIRLNPECFIYKAHFPGQPVTPGVCLVQIAVELLGETMGRQLKIRRMKEAKFLSVVSPDSCPELTVRLLKIQEDEDKVSAKLSIEGDGELKAKISIDCA